jgi:Zn-dependent protease
LTNDPNLIVATLIVIFFAIGLHEYAHCKVADMAGDPTPGIYGRVTLNLTKHFEPLGTLMIIITSLSGIGIGWGRPAPMDPRKMNNPRWDFFAAVIAGPLSNLAQAIIFGAALRFAPVDPIGKIALSPFVYMLLFQGVTINLALCLFNLFPLGPLDGHWLLGLLMPEKPRHYWYKFNAQVGTIALIVLVIGSQLMSSRGGPDILGMIIITPLSALFKMITGRPF